MLHAQPLTDTHCTALAHSHRHTPAARVVPRQIVVLHLKHCELVLLAHAVSVQLHGLRLVAPVLCIGQLLLTQIGLRKRGNGVSECSIC
jgi:hypothetical protein